MLGNALDTWETLGEYQLEPEMRQQLKETVDKILGFA
jgi:hypothetical protein